MTLPKAETCERKKCFANNFIQQMYTFHFIQQMYTSFLTDCLCGRHAISLFRFGSGFPNRMPPYPLTLSLPNAYDSKIDDVQISNIKYCHPLVCTVESVS